VAAGLNTKHNPETQAGIALLEAVNVDAFDQFQTLGVVPGSTVVSDDHGAPVASLHYFEYFALDGTPQKAILSLADGELNLVDPSTGALTELTDDLIDEHLASVQTLDKIFLTSAGQLHLPTGGIKYDGHRVTPWGIIAPGQEETVLQSFNDHSVLTGSTDATLATVAGISIDGGGSTRVNKTGTSTTLAYVQYGSGGSPLNLNLSAVGLGQGYVWLYLPPGALQKLAASGAAVEIIAGDGSLTNADHYSFQVGELLPGWNLLTWVWGTPDSDDGTGANISDIDAIRYQYNVTGAAVTLSGVLWDKFYSTDEGRPTVALGAAGNPSGTYTYRITYLTEYGLESNAGPASEEIVATSDIVALSDIPTSSDDQVIARRIYRDIDGDGLYRFVAQLDDNVTTTYNDDIADAGLALVFPPFAGSSTIDHSPPGRLYDAILHENRVVGVDPINRFVLKLSDIGDPEAFRLVDEIALEEEIQSLANHAFGTVIYGTDKTFLMTGDGVSSPIRVDPVNAQLGANGRRTTASVRGFNFTVREGEVFLVGQPADPWCINLPVLDSWEAMTKEELQNMIVIHDRSRFRVVFFESDSEDAWVWQYGAMGIHQVSGSESVDPQDLRNGAWFQMRLPDDFQVTCATIVERADDTPELWAGAADGFLYLLQDPGTSEWDVGGGETVEPSITCAPVPLGSDLGGRGTPRFIELHGTPTTVDLEVIVRAAADGEDLATVSWTATFAERNPIVPVPRMATVGSWAQVKVSGFTGAIRRLRLYYIPRGDFRGPRSRV